MHSDANFFHCLFKICRIVLKQYMKKRNQIWKKVSKRYSYSFPSKPRLKRQTVSYAVIRKKCKLVSAQVFHLCYWKDATANIQLTTTSLRLEIELIFCTTTRKRSAISLSSLISNVNWYANLPRESFNNTDTKENLDIFVFAAGEIVNDFLFGLFGSSISGIKLPRGME